MRVLGKSPSLLSGDRQAGVVACCAFQEKRGTGGEATFLTSAIKRTPNRARCSGRLYIDARLFRASHSSTKGDTNMSARFSSASALLGAVSLAASGAAFAACTGPGAPAARQNSSP